MLASESSPVLCTIECAGALKRLAKDSDGFVSFEYVVVAAVVVATVSAFKAAASGPITVALTGVVSRVGAAIATFSGG